MSQNKYTNLVELTAEGIGIKTMDNEVLDFLNVEIEEKLKTILAQAKKFMRISKRKTLKVDDLNHSLMFFNFKPLYGYDSFGNAEYEKIDSVSGLWRPKQNIIDLEDYISKPIVSCPMQVFPHFHWIAIEGKRPNVPENFIREEHKIVTDELEARGDEKDYTVTVEQPQAQCGQKNAKVIPTVIHNISKELQIFLENFEQRFRKEVKISRLNPYSLHHMTREMQISLNVMEREPGVVELLPYIIEFLMGVLANKQYVGDPKVHMIILHYVQAILSNPYFYLEPYIHQIITLLLSLVLMENNVEVIDMVVEVKDFAVEILTDTYKKYELKYPNFTKHLTQTFTENLIPNFRQPAFLTSYGAIMGINALGPANVLDIIFPKLERIVQCLNVDTIVLQAEAQGAEKSKFFNKVEESFQNSQQSNFMLIDEAPLSGSAPKISFSLPTLIGNMPYQASLFSEISNSNQQSASKVVPNEEEEKPHSLLELYKLKKIPIDRRKKAFYVYFALKESASILLEYINSLDYEQAAKVTGRLTDVFGDDIVVDMLNKTLGEGRSAYGLDLTL